MNRIAAAIIAFVVWTALAFAAGWAWRGDRAETVEAKTEAKAAKAEAGAQADARKAEQAITTKQTGAGDAADAREERIDADFDARVAAAVAGRESELGRIRKLWGQCETGRLSDGAAAAAEVAEQDRLRGASAARIVRACELAQSERDEAIDRYEALTP